MSYTLCFLIVLLDNGVSVQSATAVSEEGPKNNINNNTTDLLFPDNELTLVGMILFPLPLTRVISMSGQRREREGVILLC